MASTRAAGGPATVWSWTLTGPWLTVVVPGQPAGQGAIRYRRGRGYHANEADLLPWRASVVAHTRQAMGARRPGRELPRWPLDGPVAVCVTFTLRRPPSVRRAAPAVRPDLDHLVRAAGDALTLAGAVVDDACVVQVAARKTYPGAGPHALDAPGMFLQLYTVDVKTPPVRR